MCMWCEWTDARLRTATSLPVELSFLSDINRERQNERIEQVQVCKFGSTDMGRKCANLLICSPLQQNAFELLRTLQITILFRDSGGKVKSIPRGKQKK